MDDSSNDKARIAVLGQATMGSNLSLNLVSRGIKTAVWDRHSEVAAATVQQAGPGAPILACASPADLCRALERPRRLLLLVKAGAPVDDTIARFLDYLEPGDLIVDGGNSHPDETEARTRTLAPKGIRFVGMGIGGGSDGARHGPSLMPGGDKEAYDELAPILSAIAAKVEDGPCVAHMGASAAGHLVKTVHNGIEYGDMQLIAETYDLMQHVLRLDHEQMASAFEQWNQGILESFLIEITAKILREQDPKGSGPLVLKIVDKAGQKGTGRWTSELALRFGVPLPTIHAAIEARALSSQRDLRLRASQKLRGPESAPIADPDGLLAALGDALYCSKICSYAQGLDLLATVDKEKGWGIPLGEAARIWKGGCIIRARVLQRIQAACSRRQDLGNLLLDEELGGLVQDRQHNWRRVVGLAAMHGIPTLALSASLAYFDSLRRDRLPQNLTQAQRDWFGAHTFERTDGAPGAFEHHDWSR